MSRHEDLRERLAHADDAERDRVLLELGRRAATSGDPEDLNQLALGFVYAGRFLAAAKLWEQLLQATAPTPASDVHRMSLASAYDDLGFYALSRYHFRHLAGHGATEQLRRIGVEQLERLDEEAADRQREERLRQTRFASALQRAEKVGDLVDLETLGALLPHIVYGEPSLDRIRRARRALEVGEQRYPHSAAILWGLLRATGELGDQTGFDRVKRHLEELSASGATMLLPGNLPALPAAAVQGPPAERAGHLLDLSQQQDPAVADAATEDLRVLADSNPRDVNCVFAYGFALMGRGRLDDLSGQVGRIVALEQPTHHYHYNAGQLFIAAGDAARGARSLRLSLELARSDEDERDAREVLATFGEVLARFGVDAG